MYRSSLSTSKDLLFYGLDLAKVGILVRYLPAENNVCGMQTKVTEIDEAEANRVIENQPKFPEDADGSIRNT